MNAYKTNRNATAQVGTMKLQTKTTEGLIVLAGVLKRKDIQIKYESTFLPNRWQVYAL